MSWFAVAEILGLIFLSLGGHGLAALWVGLSVAAGSALLHGTYLAQRRGGRHMPDKFRLRRTDGPVPRHRRELDRWVLGQWVAIGVLGGGGAVLLTTLEWHPFNRVGLVFNVLVIAWVVLWSGVYLSSLFDWFLILPKVSGISCPAPCERPGEQRWAGITELWCFHRGFARLLVPATLVGSPTIIGALTRSGAGRSICFSIAAVLAVYLVDFEVQGKAALNYGLNPRRYIGDRLWLVRETPSSVSRTAAYLVDVSAEGGKFKYVEETGAYEGDRFKQKHDDDGPPLPLAALNNRHRVDDACAPCRDRCTGVNWYCWANPLAHSQTSSSGDD